MEKQWWCKCGFGPANEKEIRRHVFESCVKEKGLHGKVKEAPQPTPQSQVVSVVQAPPSPTGEKSEGYKKTGGRRWWLVWLGAGLSALAIPVFLVYNTNPSNLAMAFLLVLVGGGGISCLFFGLRAREESVKFVSLEGKQKLKGRANSLNIYYKLDKAGNLVTDRIEFNFFNEGQLKAMQDEGRLGKYQRCRNDGNYYYVHELVPVIGEDKVYKPVEEWKLHPLLLPDQVYFNPQELANVVSMPEVFKYLKPKPGKFDKIKPVLLAVGAGILAIVIIALQSPPPGG